jgi:(2Fe-2S) ferredoxin
MRSPDIRYKKLVLVCTNERTDGRECCMHRGSEDVYLKLKTAIAAVDPSIRVSKTSCLGNCLSGAIVVIMPDNIWLGDVRKDDVEKIVKMVLN